MLALLKPPRKSKLHTRILSLALVILGIGGATIDARAQAEPLKAGEGFLTRFSGTRSAEDQNGQPTPVIDIEGTVGSIISSSEAFTSSRVQESVLKGTAGRPSLLIRLPMGLFAQA